MEARQYEAALAWLAENSGDEEDDKSNWDLSDFVRTPSPRNAPPPDPDVLREQLTALREICATAEATEATEAGAETETGGTSLADSFGEDSLKRAYEPGPCTTLVITFGSLTLGYAGKPTHSEAQFEFVGACSKQRVTHALHVRDTLQSWYLRTTHAADEHDTSNHEYDALLALLQREISALAPRRVVTVGASMGGYAAIRAGLLLDADMALAFGPQVCLETPCTSPAPRRHGHASFHTDFHTYRAQVCLEPLGRQFLQLKWQVCDPPLERLRKAHPTLPMASLAAVVAAVGERSGATGGGESGSGGATGGGESSAAMGGGESGSALGGCESSRRGASSGASSGELGCAIEVHVGQKAPGDVLEARLLEACVSRGTATPGVRSVVVHEHARCGHMVAAALKESGGLDTILTAAFHGRSGGGEEEEDASYPALGADVVEVVLRHCTDVPSLQRFKLLSKAWRSAARRTLCSAGWAAQLPLRMLGREGRLDAGLERLRRSHHKNISLHVCITERWPSRLVLAYLEQLDGHVANAAHRRSCEMATRVRDTDGRLPLHVAALRSDGDVLPVVAELLRLWPESAAQRTWHDDEFLAAEGGAGAVAGSSAAEHGHLALHASAALAEPHVGVLSLLVRAFPEARAARDERSWRPLDVFDRTTRHTPTNLDARRLLDPEVPVEVS
jgi:hypothetical protein